MTELLKNLKNYGKAVRYAPARQSTVSRVLLLYALLIAYALIETEAFTYSGADGSVTIGDPFLTFNFMAVFAVHLTFHGLRSKPSVAALAPANYKHRVAFDMIYPVVMAVLTMFVIVLIGVVIALILWFIFPSEFEEEAYSIFGMGSFAVFFRFLFAYGCNIILACQKSTKKKAISFAAFIAVYFIATALTSLAIHGFDTELGFGAMYATEFNDMALPWLGYILWAIAGIGAIVTAALYLIKFEKPKEF